MIDGIDVKGCERHCSDNRNNPNMCYSEMTRTYSNCNPKEKQCNFYITSIEKQLASKTRECEELKKSVEHWKIEHKEAKAKGEWACDLLKKKYELRCNRCKLKSENTKV